MDLNTTSNEIKLIVAQTTHIHRENLGDGDDGFQITTRYVLLSNKPLLSFSRDNWIKALYLCKCELEPKEYFLLNHISAEESTISFDANIGEFIQVNPINKFVYSPISSDFFSPEFYINPFRTERICNILQRYAPNHIYIANNIDKNIIPKNQWDDRTPLDITQNECHFEIDLIRDSNVSEFSTPETISNNTLNIYLCIPSKYYEDNNEIKYNLASNIPNVIDFIPDGIKKDLYNYIGCKNWEQIYNGDFIKGQKIIHIVRIINEAIKAWGYIGPTITFHVGNELVCQYKVPLTDLYQKNRVASLFYEMKTTK